MSHTLLAALNTHLTNFIRKERIPPHSRRSTVRASTRFDCLAISTFDFVITADDCSRYSSSSIILSSKSLQWAWECASELIRELRWDEGDGGGDSTGIGGEEVVSAGVVGGEML